MDTQTTYPAHTDTDEYQYSGSTMVVLYMQACHDLVAPEWLQPVMRHMCNQFIHDRARPEEMTIGIKTVREICMRMPLVMTEEMLTVSHTLDSHTRHCQLLGLDEVMHVLVPDRTMFPACAYLRCADNASPDMKAALAARQMQPQACACFSSRPLKACHACPCINFVSLSVVASLSAYAKLHRCSPMLFTQPMSGTGCSMLIHCSYGAHAVMSCT